MRSFPQKVWRMRELSISGISNFISIIFTLQYSLFDNVEILLAPQTHWMSQVLT